MTAKEKKRINPVVIAEKALKFMADNPSTRHVWMDTPHLFPVDYNPLGFNLQAFMSREDLMRLCMAVKRKSK